MKTLYLSILSIACILIIGIISFIIIGGYEKPPFVGTSESNIARENGLTVEGFNYTYRVGEKIDFTIKFKGNLPCSPPSFMVKDAENKTIWASAIRVVLCDSDRGYGEVSWRFGELETLIINQTGSYTIGISVGNKTLEKEFKITEPPPTYLLQTVDEWKTKTPEQLYVYYEKYKDNFYTELGSFLIKDEMKKELERQKIVNIHDDFQVFPGMTLDSLPPHISYDAVVNATDGNSYLLLGGVFANKIESLKITKLVFDEDVLNFLNSDKKLSYANQFVKAPKVVISEQTGNNPLVEPYSLTLDLDKNNLVTFYNNLTVPIRIQQYGSGLTIDEGGLSWKSRIIGPNETVVIPFNKTGYYEWNARSPPKESENWWDFKGSGQIAAFSQSADNSTFQEKLKMAGTYVVDSDIPWSSVGTGNDRDLEIGLYTSVYHMIPDAQKYYTARAHQLIPFDVTVVIEVPTFATGVR